MRKRACRCIHDGVRRALGEHPPGASHYANGLYASELVNRSEKDPLLSGRRAGRDKSRRASRKRRECGSKAGRKDSAIHAMNPAARRELLFSAFVCVCVCVHYTDTCVYMCDVVVADPVAHHRFTWSESRDLHATPPSVESRTIKCRSLGFSSFAYPGVPGALRLFNRDNQRVGKAVS